MNSIRSNSTCAIIQPLKSPLKNDVSLALGLEQTYPVITYWFSVTSRMKDDPKASTWKLARAMWVDCNIEKTGISIQPQQSLSYSFLNPESKHI